MVTGRAERPFKTNRTRCQRKHRWQSRDGSLHDPPGPSTRPVRTLVDAVASPCVPVLTTWKFESAKDKEDMASGYCSVLNGRSQNMSSQTFMAGSNRQRCNQIYNSRYPKSSAVSKSQWIKDVGGSTPPGWYRTSKLCQRSVYNWAPAKIASTNSRRQYGV